MKETTVRPPANRFSNLITLIIMLASTAIPVFAQTTGDADAMQRRLMRARSLAAAHNLTAAASELDNIRNTATDDSIKDIARVMLMGVYLEGADYTRALALLEETYNARSAGNESSVRAYFTLAGQSVRGAREHLDRYRAFGINIADRDLPPEAAADLDRLRTLLERVAAQAREIREADSRSTESVALLEDVASVRATLARNREERQRWQGETADARQTLAVSETRIANMGSVPGRPATPVNMPTSTSAPVVSGNSGSGNSTSVAAKPPAQNAPLTKKTVAVSENAPPKSSTKQDNTQPSTQPAALAANGQPLNLGSLIDKATQRISPNYPQTARSARVTGVVKVFVLVNENGEVTKIQRTDGPSLLRGAAESAAKLWKFRPAMVDGQAVSMTGFISFNFTL